MSDLEKQDLKNKKVIVRVDLNVPLDDNDNVTDTTRIVACKETVDLILEKGGTCILISHLGRPEGKENKFSLKKIVDTVSSVLNQPVFFYEDCIGQGAQEAISKLDQGSIILMENLRFYKEETFEPPKRLEKRNYAIPFKVLINFNLIKTFAINRYNGG